MGNGGVENKRKVLDPGNVLFVVYVGFVMCLIFLAMVADSYASVDHGGEGGKAVLSEVRAAETLYLAGK